MEEEPWRPSRFSDSGFIVRTSDFTGTVGKVKHLGMISIQPDDGKMGPTTGVSSISLFKPQSCHLSLDRKNNLVVDMEIYTLTNVCLQAN